LLPGANHHQLSTDFCFKRQKADTEHGFADDHSQEPAERERDALAVLVR